MTTRRKTSAGNASRTGTKRKPPKRPLAKGAGRIPRGGKERLVIFVDPSLHEDARRYLETAEFRGPARVGDLDEVETGWLVAIIDGAEGDSPISAQEIRGALARGARVVGAGGSGALRAAEIPEMLGVGEIHRRYASGALFRDDEVAVVRDPVTGARITEPLVNVRYAVEQLVRAGSVSASTGDAIVHSAMSLHFRSRTYSEIVRTAGLGDKADVDALIQGLKSVDLTRNDAITLFERLPELASDPHWKTVRQSLRKPRDVPTRVSVAASSPADAPVMIWEDGETVDFPTLILFVALTGGIDALARQALLHDVASGKSARFPKGGRSSSPGVSELISQIAQAWGWETDPELHITLRDLGFGANLLAKRLAAEGTVRAALRQRYARLQTSLLGDLRFELLLSDLTLKREAMRLGAIQTLAKDRRGAATRDELVDAKRALLQAAQATTRLETWDELLAAFELRRNQVEPFVDLLARARRRGLPLLEDMERAALSAGHEPKGVRHLEAAPYVNGAGARSIADEKAQAIARLLGKAVGIVRVAGLSEMERIGGLHVAAAYRVGGGSMVGCGKSEHLDGAIAGAIMEQVETYCFEKYEAATALVAPFSECDPSKTVDPAGLFLPYDSRYRPDRPIPWTAVQDLVTNETVLVPSAAVDAHRTKNDPYYSPRLAKKWASTNGLASSFTLTEALLHGFCELIERHAFKLAEQEIANPGRLPGARDPFLHMDLTTSPASTRRILAALETGGYVVRVTDITSEIAVPTFYSRVLKPSNGGDDQPLFDHYGPGCCTHPNPEIALNRAILEGVQSLVIHAAGAYDVALNARSLGRHERPRPMGLGEAGRLAPWVAKRAFTASEGFVGTSAREDLEFVIRRLTAARYERALYCNLTLSFEALRPAQVVRVLIPDLESNNPLHTGPRARVSIVKDLMRRHEW